jgi:hypothetical protein
MSGPYRTMCYLLYLHIITSIQIKYFRRGPNIYILFWQGLLCFWECENEKGNCKSSVSGVYNNIKGYYHPVLFMWDILYGKMYD